jgi:hypothetical protein
MRLGLIPWCTGVRREAAERDLGEGTRVFSGGRRHIASCVGPPQPCLGIFSRTEIKSGKCPTDTALDVWDKNVVHQLDVDTYVDR